MFKKILLLVMLLGFVSMFYTLFDSYEVRDELQNGSLGQYYAQNGAKEVGAANLVTAVVVTYRGFDTLGEVTILFLSASIIGFMLKLTGRDRKKRKSLSPTSELLETGSKILFPLIILFGIYVFINGHLTPGGGFQGGAIIASAIALLILGNPNIEINHKLIGMIESISGLSYVIIGIVGIIIAGGFLDNRILDLGKFGTLISAGAIPIIYIFLGLKVGTELTGIIASLQENQE